MLHEDTMTGGIGAEISSRIHETCFEHLDAPVARTASLDTAFPFAEDLERNFMANDRLEGDLQAPVGTLRPGMKSAPSALHDARVFDHGFHLLDVVFQHAPWCQDAWPLES